MEENKSLAAGDSAEITLDGFGLDEARELKQTLVRFLQEYGKKPAELSDEDWLCQRFLSELPDMEEQEARGTNRETFESIQEYNQNLASLRAARAQGSTAEEWFADKSREAASGVSAVEFGRRMEELSEVLGGANAQLPLTPRRNWKVLPFVRRYAFQNLGKPMERTPLMLLSKIKTGALSTNINSNMARMLKPQSR